jgi:hypothetical protein
MKLGAIRGTLGVPGSCWISPNLSGSRLFTARHNLTPGAITNLGRARQRDPCRPQPAIPARISVPLHKIVRFRVPRLHFARGQKGRVARSVPFGTQEV